MKTAINDAFDSLEKANSSPDNELRLIETNIFKEAVDDATVDYIKAQIVPSKRDLSSPIDKAFGVFLGYTLGLDATQFSNTRYRQAVQDQMKKDIQDNVSHIASKISEKKLGAYSFYFYVLPFDDALTDRVAIIKKLKGE